MKRGLRQLVVVAILAVIIVALGTTAVTGGARDPERVAEPSVEQHVAALAAGASALGADLPVAVRDAVARQSRLIGPPRTTEPLFSWLPESEPREPVIAPAADVAGFTDQLETSARTILRRALSSPIAESTEPDGARGHGESDEAAVPPERLRTLVAVGLEQVQALEALDAERAAALRADVASAALESGSASLPAAGASSTPEAPTAPTTTASAGTESSSAESSSAEPSRAGPASAESGSTSASPSGPASPDAPETVAAERCAPVVTAADAAYRTAYLYEYAAVRSQVEWPDEGIIPEEPAAGPALGEPLTASPVADPAAWWPVADRREVLGDRLADLLPQGCAAVREPAYAAPADPELPDALAEAEVQFALALRDAAAAAPVSPRGWLLVEALAATARATEDPWLTLTATD